MHRTSRLLFDNVNEDRKDVDNCACQKSWSNYCPAVVDPSVQMSFIGLLHFISLLLSVNFFSRAAAFLFDFFHFVM